MAERCQAFDLLDGLVCESRERSLGVDEELGDTIFGGDVLLGVGTKGGSECVDRGGADRQPGRSLVSAVGDQMLVAGDERFVQVEAWHAAA